MLPAAEQFIFRRSNSRDPNLSSYMADRFGRVDEEDEEESEEETFASSQDYRRPQLDPTSEGIITSLLCSHVHRQLFVRQTRQFG